MSTLCIYVDFRPLYGCALTNSLGLTCVNSSGEKCCPQNCVRDEADLFCTIIGVCLGFGRQEIMADYIIVYLLLWFSYTMIWSTLRSKPFLQRALSHPIFSDACERKYCQFNGDKRTRTRDDARAQRVECHTKKEVLEKCARVQAATGHHQQMEFV